jgi:hypothetical protein
MKIAAFYVGEGQITYTLNIEVRLSQADVENGAIGCRSDMWAEHQPSTEKTPLCRTNAQQPVPWTRTENAVGFELSHIWERMSDLLG